ncbi:Fucoxanthin-chlorophyll a-c binding protein E [Durusdinium trenchii]|uniref:Chloroplastic n=1 Tax=Durusdinium trenchii TaxID=1381693 RepID=A0ABP0LRZ0_9DINO
MAKSMGLMAAAASAAYLCREAFVPSSGATEAPASPALLRGAERVGQRSTSGGTVLPSLCGAALVASAASSLKRRKAACKAFENEMGATLPFKYFDPLGMAKDGDQETFRRRRIAEIKNGRVAMMACMGYIAPEYFRWPGYCSPSTDLKFADIPNGTQALYKMPAEAWAQIACFIGFLELFPMRQEKDRIPGDAPGFGKLGLPFATKADPEKNSRSLDAEINNGRLAMVAITGMISQNAFFGTTGPDMWLPGASAFEGELGVQAPVGYWDPLGLSADGDVEAFKRRRAVELKHGRIYWLASQIGYIVPEYFRWPGYLSPEKGLKFADMPHGIAAVSKVPLEGWVQIALFIGHMEGYFWRQDAKRAPGDYEGYGFLGVGKNFIFNFEPIEFKDPEVKKTKLRAEIANGRLAMVALMAMLFQNGTVGTTGPAMWLPVHRTDIEQPAMSFRGGEKGVFGVPQVKGERTERRAALCGGQLGSEAKPASVLAATAAGAYFCSQAFVVGQAPSSQLRAHRSTRSGADHGSNVSGLASGTALCLVAAVGAARGRKTVCKSFESELGATLPFKYFDPLGMAKDGDKETFRRRRIAEIKNGRVAMWACMGYIAPEYFRWPGYCSPSADLKFADIPNGIQALYKMPAEAWAQIAVFIGFLELFPCRQEADRIPGDAPGFGKLGLPFATKADPEANRRSLEAEINNGRLAMVAITGMISQNAFFGTTGPDMWLPGASAFEGELGVQAPVGYWDPLGLSADGDVETFKRRRAVELKHGRICMLACVGYIVPEYFRWPGYLSPEKGIKFADMPHGIAAVSKVPLEGWVQIALFIGHMEGYFWRQDPKRAPGDYEGYGFLGTGKNFIFNFEPIEFKDDQVKKTKLAAEIANGRLAMVALMAMLFQNGTVGTTGPAMWLPAA